MGVVVIPWVIFRLMACAAGYSVRSRALGVVVKNLYSLFACNPFTTVVNMDSVNQTLLQNQALKNHEDSVPR
jgi:hypothetical protein